ncbi:I78 family peptidase inhibitor [Erythrobacter sp. THAF29]|uniref:I78 family peptidase inhibitor n=1 Tax=Erythrobacter sp. THAF29 TaxID=2587851 RepID=UPI0012694406|nr:I78 family peptidase inhibitor [Erythrobacter sp. THAF29]QFT78832.1 Peptidase inhibitor I78 family protein [Erythrobacter sp. THAF29]
MRHTAFTAIAAFALLGCTSEYGASEPVDSTPEPIEKPVTHRCDPAPVQHHVGHDATQAIGEAILNESGAKTLRWGPPDSVWTMDYREDRVNVRYDRDMKITAVTCG